METTRKYRQRCLLTLIWAGILSSCTNNLNINSVLTTIQSTIPVSESGNSSQGTFTLGRVVKNNLNPTGTLDLIGDGTGTFGQLCQSSDGATGTNTCNCTYTYSSPTVPNQQLDTPVIYSETDLIRCNYGTISTDVKSLKVSVHLTTADTYSNQVIFNYSGSSVSLDTSLIASFVEPRRYQCHDILVGVNYLFDSKIYDPIQSENFHKTFPLDFYYTNPGGNLSTYSAAQAGTANTSLSNWICPPILNPETTFSNSTDLKNYNSLNHVNLAVYSKAGLTVGDTIYRKVIYPPPPHPLQPGNIDRSTFLLSKQPSGIFSVPVNAYVSPGVNTTSDAILTEGYPPPPLGYGASPISTGSGQESCPDSSIPIPTKHHWVKLWLFRASLDARTMAWPGPKGNGPNQASSLFDLNVIYCNPGNWDKDSTTYQEPNLQIFPALNCPRDISDFLNDRSSTPAPHGNHGTWTDGGVTYKLRPASISLKSVRESLTDPLNLNYILADRVLGTGQCVRLDAVAGVAGPAYYDSYNFRNKHPNCTNGPGLGCGDEKQDFWATWVLDYAQGAVPTDAVFNADTTTATTKGYDKTSIGIGCNATPLSDPLNVCGNIVAPQTKNVTSAAAPHSTNINSLPLDSGSSRFDFLFVVTPTDIMLNDMRDATLAGAPYQPYRFETDVDCFDPITEMYSTDPDVTHGNYPTLCKNSTSINTYGLKLHDVGDNGDAPANDPSRAGVFPVCAIQPD